MMHTVDQGFLKKTKCILVYFVRIVGFFVYCGISHELCDQMQSEVDSAKFHHRIIAEVL